MSDFPILNNILSGDVNLAGLGEDATATLLGQVNALPAPQRKKAFAALIKKAANQGTPALSPVTGSRAEFMRNYELLPKEIQDVLNGRRAQLVDSVYYTTKYAEGSQTLKMFTDDDNKIVGVNKINNQKMPKGEYFMLYGIRLTSADSTSTSVSQANNATLNFGVAIDGVLNGEFKMTAGGKIIVPERTSMRVFDTTNNNNVVEGFWKLDNPKLIQPQVDIVFDIEFGAAVNGTNNTFIRVELVGSTVVPY